MTGVRPLSPDSLPYPRQAGVVLVAVLWVVVLLMVIATGVTSQYRTQQRLVGNLVTSAQAGAAAEGGVYYLLHTLERRAARGERILPESAYPVRLGRADVEGFIQDERGKVDLNTAPGELIRGVMLAAELSFEQSDALTDAILDWRDDDHLRRLHGAEDRDYHHQGRLHGAKDAPFDSVDELRQVLGMTPALFDRVRDGFTVYTGAVNVNPRSAPLLVLQAIPGMTAASASAYWQARRDRLAEGLAPPSFPLAGSPHVTSDSGPAYALVVEARIDKRTTARVKAIVVHENGQDAGFRIASWQRD